MELVQVDTRTCAQCGVCAATCPGALIDFRTNDYPKSTAEAELACVRCGHCVAVCPTHSLTHRDLPGDQFPLIQPGLKISPEQCEQVLRSRRSIRAYKNQPVPREMIVRLIETARYAPTGHNNQDVEWLVIDGRESLDRIERIGAEWIRWLIKNQAPMPGFDLNKMLERQEQNNNGFLRGAPVMIAAHAAKNNSMAQVDCTIALTYLDLAASSQGLGCCWAGFIMFMANTFSPLKEALKLPVEHSGYGFMLLGYPEFKYQRLPWRKPPPITWQS